MASDVLPSDAVKWMWGDPTTFSHYLATINPLRWSSSKNPAETAQELEQAAEKDKYDANRPVQMVVTRAGSIVLQKCFNNAADAVAALKSSSAPPSTLVSSDTSEKKDVATLILPDGRKHEIRLIHSKMDDDMFLDIRDLYAKTGCFTFDPGFTNTASCMSAITYIDGPKGICLYRGYPVQDLCENSHALESAYLLLYGGLPTAKELANFTREVKENMSVHGKVEEMFGNFEFQAHPMAIMMAVIGGLSTIFSESHINDAEYRRLACIRLIAKLPCLAAMAYKTSTGQPIMYPLDELTFAENFLYMMFATPMQEYKVNPTHAKIIDAFMILHMDHEQNASTSTVRTAGSSQANPYACIAAGVASLWGPAHGGANEAALNMLEQIGSVDRVPQFVQDVKDKKDGVRLMGFGHRVYKNYDPRARVMKKLVDTSLKKLGIADPLLDVAIALEEVALKDDYFTKRKLYPNVDFYSGILLRAIGIPTSMFTVMFAMSRTVGWMTQWNEMITEGQMRISRPRQIYDPGDNPQQRDYKKDSALSVDAKPQYSTRLTVKLRDIVTR